MLPTEASLSAFCLRCELFFLELYIILLQLTSSITMEGFGLPMSFGKKSKNTSVNVEAKLQQTKREDAVGAHLSIDVRRPVR